MIFYVLAIAGNILTEEIKVATQANWPDYVFDEEYDLKKLKDLEQFIVQNKHLPNIPDANTVKKDGYDLSEMDVKLLEKIKELSLLNKRLEVLEKENKQLKERFTNK